MIDATSVQAPARQQALRLARELHVVPSPSSSTSPEEVCRERNRARAGRQVPPHVIAQQVSQLRGAIHGLEREGFRHVFVLDSVDEVERVEIVRVPLANDRRDEHGPFDIKLVRALRGKNVQVRHGLARSLEELEAETPEFRAQVAEFLDDLVSHYVFDDGRLVVAHAGLKEALQGRASGEVRSFALYGDTTGETDASGLPVRRNWAAEYCGRAMVVYGHTPVPEPEWLNTTINVDTGCVFGGKLTPLRYPERELVSVPARAVYAESARPFLPEGTAPDAGARQAHDDVLDLDDVAGERRVETRQHRE